MNAEAKPRIGFIGLGLMGHGMAKNLVTKGYPLTVRAHRNRNPLEDIVAAGAKEVATDAEVARAGGDEVLERLAVAVRADGEREALGHEILRHAVAHEAEPDEADLRLRVSVHRFLR